MKSVKLVLGVMLAFVLAYGAYTVYAAADIIVVPIQGTPGCTFATSTIASLKVAVPDNDLTIAATGMQADGSTASVTTDYSIIMPAVDSTGATSTMHDRTSYGSGVQANQFIILQAGGSVTVRGYDYPYITADTSKEFIIQSYGHTMQVTIIKGSGLSHNP